MEPNDKSDGMKKMLDVASMGLFGKKRTSCIQEGVCVSCGKPAVEFKDDISKKEFSISGLCQSCQDSV